MERSASGCLANASSAWLMARPMAIAGIITPSAIPIMAATGDARVNVVKSGHVDQRQHAENIGLNQGLHDMQHQDGHRCQKTRHQQDQKCGHLQAHHIAEQADRQCNGAGNFADQMKRQEDGARTQVMAQIGFQALGADAEPVRREKDDDRQCGGGGEIPRRRMQAGDQPGQIGDYEKNPKTADEWHDLPCCGATSDTASSMVQTTPSTAACSGPGSVPSLRVINRLNSQSKAIIAQVVTTVLVMTSGPSETTGLIRISPSFMDHSRMNR